MSIDHAKQGQKWMVLIWRPTQPSHILLIGLVLLLDAFSYRWIQSIDPAGILYRHYINSSTEESVDLDRGKGCVELGIEQFPSCFP